MGGVATGHAPEDRLRLSVLSIHMPTLGACPAGVPGIDGNQLAAAPLHLVGELAPELRPALVQDGLVQTTLGAHVASGRHSAALGRCAHVPDLQILDDHHGMLRSDLAAGLVQEVLAHVGDAAVQALHAGLGLVPVPAAPDLARHPALVAREAYLVTLEAGQRCPKICSEDDGSHAIPTPREQSSSELTVWQHYKCSCCQRTFACANTQHNLNRHGSPPSCISHQ